MKVTTRQALRELVVCAKEDRDAPGISADSAFYQYHNLSPVAEEAVRRATCCLSLFPPEMVRKSPILQFYITRKGLGYGAKPIDLDGSGYYAKLFWERHCKGKTHVW